MFHSRGRGLQHRGLRRANERAVLNVVGFTPGLSNAEIARNSGLAPQTVSAILLELERTGLIERGEVLRGRRGQPATPIHLRASGGYSIGVEIGWHHVDVLLINMHADILAHRRTTHVYPEAPRILASIGELANDIAQLLPRAARARLIDIGVARPGDISGAFALPNFSGHMLEQWQQLDMASEIGRRTGLEVTLFNSGNVACWAEMIAFPKPRPANFICFMLSQVVTAGIIGEGSLWEGPTGNSANLGAMLVPGRDGKMGSLHDIASIKALEARLQVAGIVVNGVDVNDWDWTSFGAIGEAWISDAAHALAVVVFNTGTVIESGLVIVDAITPSAVTTRLVDKLQAELARLPLNGYAPPQVIGGRLGALAPAIGAAELTLYKRFFSRALTDIAG